MDDSNHTSFVQEKLSINLFNIELLYYEAYKFFTYIDFDDIPFSSFSMGNKVQV